MRNQRRSDEDLTEDLAQFFEPRKENQYSQAAMRRIHEGQSQYGSPDVPRARQQRVVRQREVSDAVEDEDVKPPRRRKKHRFLKFLLKLLLLALVLVLLAGAGLWLLARMPKSNQSIGQRKPGCATILLAGTDQDGERTDTIMLLYLDSNQKTMRLLSIPRDTMVNRTNPVPKINGAYGANGSGVLGMDALMGYVQDLVGYRPDGYMLIDFDCFEQLVDTMGGVNYDVPMDMYYEDPVQDLVIDLKQGYQHLNGEQSMWLVRFRSGYELADLERVNVQRDFLSTAAKQWVSVLRLPRLPFAFKLAMENTTTDLSLLELVWVAKTVVLCRENFGSDTLPGYGEYIGGGSYYIESVYDAAALINEKYNPYNTVIYADSLHPYGR